MMELYPHLFCVLIDVFGSSHSTSIKDTLLIIQSQYVLAPHFNFFAWLSVITLLFTAFVANLSHMEVGVC